MSADGNSARSNRTEPTMEENMVVDVMNSSSKEVLSNEQLCSKINAFRNLCSSNKINSDNAFDLNMTEYFHKWLKKKTQEDKLIQEDLFQDMSDYLDTTGKIYSCRIDSLNDSINSLYEKIRMEGLIKNDMNNLVDNGTNINGRHANKHNKRTRAMITTSDKLRGNPIDSYNTLETPFDLMELTKAGRPSEYFLSMFHNTTFAEQFKKDLENSKKVVQSSDKFTMKNLTRQINEREICSEFSGFMAENNMLPCNIDLNLDYIEDRYNPDDDPLKNSINNEISMDYDNRDDLGSNLTMEQRVQQFSELVSCTNGAKSDYSYFNPTLLVNWSGPKAWKTQTLKKSLEVRNRGEYSKVPISSLEDFDGELESRPKKLKQSKNQKKVTENKDLVIWINTEQANSMLSKLITGKEQVLPQTLAKWHSISNAGDPLPFNYIHKFSFLEYLEIKPDWLILLSDEEKITDEKDNFPENLPLNDDQDNNSIDAENSNTGNDFDNDINVYDNISQKSNDEEEDDDILTKETKLDVTVLKTEIMNIINQESDLLSINDNSTGISFNKLLQKLNAFEREISIALIYVAILHLSNEKRLHFIRIVSDQDIAKVYLTKFKKPST